MTKETETWLPEYIWTLYISARWHKIQKKGEHVFNACVHAAGNRESKGRVGRPITKDSLRQQVFRALSEGAEIGDVVKLFPGRQRTIYHYGWEWKNQRGRSPVRNLDIDATAKSEGSVDEKDKVCQTEEQASACIDSVGGAT